jgi:hypothetical protein
MTITLENDNQVTIPEILDSTCTRKAKRVLNDYLDPHEYECYASDLASPEFDLASVIERLEADIQILNVEQLVQRRKCHE